MGFNSLMSYALPRFSQPDSIHSALFVVGLIWTEARFCQEMVFDLHHRRLKTRSVLNQGADSEGQFLTRCART